MPDPREVRNDLVAFVEAITGATLTEPQRRLLRNPPTPEDFVRHEQRRRKVIGDLLRMQGKLVRRAMAR